MQFTAASTSDSESTLNHMHETLFKLSEYTRLDDHQNAKLETIKTCFIRNEIIYSCAMTKHFMQKMKILKHNPNIQPTECFFCVTYNSKAKCNLFSYKIENLLIFCI